MFNTKADLITFIIICLVLFLMLSAFIIIFLIKFQERKIFFNESFKSLKDEHINEILKVEIEVQEQTFQNISQELHDNIGQKLSYARLKVNSLLSGFPELEEELLLVDESLGEVISDIRDLSRSKSAEYIYSNGLLNALEQEISQIKKLKKFNTALLIDGETYFLENQTEIMIFRIIQEGLHNIIKHSEATNISVNLFFDPNELRIVISDDGKGFVRNKEKSNHMGLTNMLKRVERLGGKIEFGKNIPKGTQIFCRIPNNKL